MAITLTEPAILRLMQLSSVSLPVGGYAFSQGLEYAVEAGWVKHIQDVDEWLQLHLQQSFTRLDLAVLFRLYPAIQNQRIDDIQHWNQFILAARETSELKLTDTAMGMALCRLLPDLGIKVTFLNTNTLNPQSHQLNLKSNQPDLKSQENRPQSHDISFVTSFATAAVHWHIPLQAAAMGLAWSWLENQVAAATKLVPLGQTQAQQLLGQLQQLIPQAIKEAGQLQDHELGAALPALALASSLHEKQYSRLFRS